MSRTAFGHAPFPTKRRLYGRGSQIGRLNRLKRRGTHGTTIAGVTTTFIEAGARSDEKGYIQLEDDE
jgi:hypothetical protein